MNDLIKTIDVKQWSRFIGNFAEYVFDKMIGTLFKRLAGRKTQNLTYIPSVCLLRGKKTVGELDMIAVDHKGQIVAVFEVKASYTYAMARKAVSQMKRVRKMFKSIPSDLTVCVDGKKIPFPYTVCPGTQYYTAHLVRSQSSMKMYVQKVGRKKRRTV